MRLLVLGGTRFVGRAIVEEALGRGHEVTTFNRGHTGVDVAGVETVRGDRESSVDLQRLVAGRSWDVVVDTSGYVPRVVGNAARALLGLAGRYVFLSTISVYPDWPANGVSEASPVYECSPDAGGSAADEASWSATQYGTYKAGCERAVAEVFGDRALVLRPGVILGPQENVGRLTWWLRRIARGGRVLGPGSPDRSIQPIDVRDVASFALDLAGPRRAAQSTWRRPRGTRPSGRCSRTAPTPPAPTASWCGSTTGSWSSKGYGSGPRSRCGACTRAPGTGTRPWPGRPVCCADPWRRRSGIPGPGWARTADRRPTVAKHSTASVLSGSNNCLLCGRHRPARARARTTRQQYRAMHARRHPRRTPRPVAQGVAHRAS